MVSIIIVTYNGQYFIKNCLKSVFKQTYTDIEVIVIDNGSTDETRELLEELRITNYPEGKPTASYGAGELRIIFNEENLGFSGGYNQGIRESKGEYVLCLNQDVILDKDFVRAGVEIFENDDKIGAAQGKILRSRKQEAGSRKQEVIDTTGLVIFKNRRVIRRGEGEGDRGQYDKIKEIFAVDGAAAFYRKTALEDVKIRNPQFSIRNSQYEYFDQDFFLYKEDIDLSWRLRLGGWKIIYCPKAVAWHHRTEITNYELRITNFFNILKSRREMPNYAKFYSFKNQRLMQIKNELPLLFLKHLPWILVREISEWFYVLFFEKEGLKSIWTLVKQTPNAWRKRKIIMAGKKVETKEMARWFQ